ncbi:unnamed protein product [Symbiodinium necroappetens]|uniref:Uncharacterized protein n=1 Tax=Symbiodinium necroappetens TaxID=1628268 RepID=A0A812MK84_9DINO|nr:unnamed protein product [Symbiodinium necroappetens]
MHALSSGLLAGFMSDEKSLSMGAFTLSGLSSMGSAEQAGPDALESIVPAAGVAGNIRALSCGIGSAWQATAVLMTANARAIRELPKDHLEYLESSAERKVGEEVTEAALSRPELHSVLPLKPLSAEIEDTSNDKWQVVMNRVMVKAGGRMAAALVSTTSAPQPHEVFPASSVIELCGAAVLRTAEDLNSENCGELEQGQACFVLGHGTSPDSRRLQVYVIGKGLRGWISCVAKSGRKLVTMIGAPGSDVAAGAAGEFQAIAGAAVAGAYAGSPRSGSVFSAAPAMPMVTQHSQSSACTPCQSVTPAMPMPAVPACGTMRSNHSACVGQAIQSQGAMPAMPGVGTMQSQSAMQAWSPAAAVQSQASSYSASRCQVDIAPRSCGFSAASDAPEAQGRGNAVPPAARLTLESSSTVNSSSVGQFPPGCRVAVLDEMVMRAEESLKSEQLAVLEEASGTLGWISFVAQSGRPLAFGPANEVKVEVKGLGFRVALAAAEVAPPAFAAMPSNRSRSTSAAGIGTASASIFSAQEAPVEHGVSIPMPATGVASVASRVSRVSYHPQVITQEVEPAGKQWLRRQKAQDLREEAPKRFLVDNRLLHAGTEGVNYRFSKDLEDIDLSCTALWGSVVEGVDEGDGWLCVSGELYLPMQLAGVPILTIEESPWALAGLQVVEAFPIGSAVLMLEAAIMRAAEDLRSTAICQLEKEQQMQILGHGAGARNRRLFVQDPVSGQDGWISFVSQTGKLLVTPLDHSPEQMQKVATMITTRQQLESFDGQGASVSMEVAQAQEEPAAPETQQAFLVDNRAFKADSDGVGYRASPDLEDKVVPARTALWGTVVHGVADDEGWLRVGAYYLPMALKGIRVLTPEAEAPKAHLPQLPGFARGDWEYICIDPKGASTYFQPGAPSESGQASFLRGLVAASERLVPGLGFYHRLSRAGVEASQVLWLKLRPVDSWAYSAWHARRERRQPARAVAAGVLVAASCLGRCAGAQRLLQRLGCQHDAAGEIGDTVIQPLRTRSCHHKAIGSISAPML